MLNNLFIIFPDISLRTLIHAWVSTVSEMHRLILIVHEVLNVPHLVVNDDKAFVSLNRTHLYPTGKTQYPI